MPEDRGPLGSIVPTRPGHKRRAALEKLTRAPRSFRKRVRNPSLARSVRESLRPFLDAVWPPSCFLCAAGAPDSFACEAHEFSEGLVGARCGRCAVRLAAGWPHGAPCLRCRTRPPAFARVVALADYDSHNGLRPWILALKHGRRPDLARPLGTRLAHAARASGLAAGSPRGPRSADLRDAGTAGRRSRAPWLVPVPIHPLRRLDRGHDQALGLARILSCGLGLPVARPARRIRNTPPQGTPGPASRSSNVRGAFAVRRRFLRGLAARDIWIVDDVMTSGSTAHELARVLRDRGAGRVGVLVLARAPLPDGF